MLKDIEIAVNIISEILIASLALQDLLKDKND